MEAWLDRALAEPVTAQSDRFAKVEPSPIRSKPARLEATFPPAAAAEIQAPTVLGAELLSAPLPQDPSEVPDSTSTPNPDFEPAPAMPPAAVVEGSGPVARSIEPPASVSPPPPTREAQPAPPPPAPAPPSAKPVPAVRISSGPSCEAAQAAYREEIVIGAPRAPDLPREALAAVLNSGSVLAGCGVPDSMKLEICAAIQRGRAVGVTVTTRPGSRRVSACVASQVRGLRFPSSPHLDVATTRF